LIRSSSCSTRRRRGWGGGGGERRRASSCTGLAGRAGEPTTRSPCLEVRCALEEERARGEGRRWRHQARAGASSSRSDLTHASLFPSPFCRRLARSLARRLWHPPVPRGRLALLSCAGANARNS
jgi:hypothetical protein